MPGINSWCFLFFNKYCYLCGMRWIFVAIIWLLSLAADGQGRSLFDGVETPNVWDYSIYEGMVDFDRVWQEDLLLPETIWEIQEESISPALNYMIIEQSLDNIYDYTGETLPDPVYIIVLPDSYLRE
jgi:hypothetical protein